MDNNNMYGNGDNSQNNGIQNNGVFTGNEQGTGYGEPNQNVNQSYSYGEPNQNMNHNNGYGQPGNNQGYQYPNQGGYQQELEEPMSMGEWLVTLLLLFFVPCVNIILMFVWAFSSKEKKSKSNFCKAYLIITGITLVIYVIILIGFGMVLAAAA